MMRHPTLPFHRPFHERCVLEIHAEAVLCAHADG